MGTVTLTLEGPPPMANYLILATRTGKVVRLRRNSVPEAFQVASKLRQLGYAVKVRRPGETTLAAEVERAVTA